MSIKFISTLKQLRRQHNLIIKLLLALIRKNCCWNADVYLAAVVGLTLKFVRAVLRTLSAHWVEQQKSANLPKLCCCCFRCHQPKQIDVDLKIVCFAVVVDVGSFWEMRQFLSRSQFVQILKIRFKNNFEFTFFHTQSQISHANFYFSQKPLKPIFFVAESRR